MITEIGIVTSHGCPSSMPLESPSKIVSMLSPTNEYVGCFLGNVGTDTPLANGFSVHTKALNKSPWLMGKSFFIPVNNMFVQAKNGDIYNHQFAINTALITRGLYYEGQWYCYIVVDNASNARFRYWPVTRLIKVPKKPNY